MFETCCALDVRVLLTQVAGAYTDVNFCQNQEQLISERCKAQHSLQYVWGEMMPL